MHAIEITSPGGPEVLRLVERPSPIAVPGEVVIAVEAADVNRPDLMQREGRYPPPAGVTDIPGLEVAGRIAAIGPAADAGSPRSASGHVWQIGQPVLALVAGGGYAEQCAVPGVQCPPIPPGVSMVGVDVVLDMVGGAWCWDPWPMGNGYC